MIIQGDCLKKLKELEENSIDSIVTDPPYGLSFMGKKWDYDVPKVEIWKECLRVLKPGGYLLAFAGTRTQHRMAVNIEDAGFEIRDMIAWVYGSGFPKSHNIGKAVDKMLGAERKVVGMRNPNRDNSIRKLRVYEGIGGEGKQGLAEKKCGGLVEITEPSTQEAKKWEGWGTALKPALEPITVARKPFRGTVASNVLKYGTGGINIDGCRIKHNEPVKTTNRKQRKEGWNPDNCGFDSTKNNTASASPQGRFPANLILDEEAGKILDKQSGESKSGKNKLKKGTGGIWQKSSGLPCGQEYGDKGGASRFFYCAKASKSDRNEGLDGFEEKNNKFGNQKNGEDLGNGSVNDKFTTQPSANNHPTVKPTKLMQYLVRLVTPKDGTVLDPFMGSGSTGKACVLEDFKFIGIEMDEEYCKIAEARIKHVKDKPKQKELI